MTCLQKIIDLEEKIMLKFDTLKTTIHREEA